MSDPIDDKQAARDELKANAEKALEMKRKAGSPKTTPEDRTAHEGGVQGSQIPPTDPEPGKEGTFHADLSRAHNARVGDTGKTTGPGRRTNDKD